MSQTILEIKEVNGEMCICFAVESGVQVRHLAKIVTFTVIQDHDYLRFSWAERKAPIEGDTP